jgi:hypothetical protein
MPVGFRMSGMKRKSRTVVSSRTGQLVDERERFSARSSRDPPRTQRPASALEPVGNFRSSRGPSSFGTFRAMLHEFLTANRRDLLDRCSARVVHRLAPSPSDADLKHGIPLYLDQLIEMLQAQEDTPDPKVSNASNEGEAGSGMGVSATRHGRELMRRGFTVEQVVRENGDLCQEMTGLGNVVIFDDRALLGLPR